MGLLSKEEIIPKFQFLRSKTRAQVTMTNEEIKLYPVYSSLLAYIELSERLRVGLENLSGDVYLFLIGEMDEKTLKKQQAESLKLLSITAQQIYEEQNRSGR